MPVATDSGLSISPWMATAEMPPVLPLEESIQADVCIVGAGMAGLTTAYLLSREGRSVVVLDDGPLAGGESGRTTAHLASVPDEGYVKLERLFGEKGARLAHESHAIAVDTIEAISSREGIDCEFERLPAYLFEPPGESSGYLDRELQAARRAGVAVDKIAQAPLSGFNTGPCLAFKGQAQFHPLKYLAGVARAITARGGRLYTRARAEDFEGGANARVVTASGHTVSARAVVVATNSPVNERVLIHIKQFPHRTYVIAARVPAGSIYPALYWDTDTPYHYVRLARLPEEPQNELLVVGGEDHRTGQASDPAARYARLEAWMRERFPAAGEVVYRWSGQIMEPADGLAFIGRSPADEDNVLIATGDSGNGMTHGTIAGLLLTDLVMGRETAWEALYDPSRLKLRAVGSYAKGNVQSTAPYSRWITAGEVSSPDEVLPGEGAIMRRGLHMVAVYRDPAGQVVERSAVCRHLGCIVAWNPAEKSWDCPCHGSRYAPDGHVMNGPAAEDLEEAEPE